MTQTLTAILPYLIGATLIAVLATLFSGLFSMSKGGDLNRRHSNRLMWLRVALQALAVSLFVAYMLLTRL